MSNRPLISGRKYVAATGHPLASMAATEIMRLGGNAIDAGVGAGIALSVLESTLVSFGGVAPIIVYLAESDEVVTISGLGGWPRAVDPDYFQRLHGGRMPAGILRTIVPAAPDAWITALGRYGRMSFADVASFAIEFAEDGFLTYPFMTELIDSSRDKFGAYPSNREIYLPDGQPPRPGTLFRQPALASSIRYMAEEDRAAAARGGREAGLAAARGAFYEGDIAREILAFHRDHGGLLTAEDLSGFSVAVEASAAIEYRGWEVHACGPWCQGPMLLQILKIVEGFDLSNIGHNTADYLHILCEAVKIAAKDRDDFYGDPRFVDVPIADLLSDERAGMLRAQIDASRAETDYPHCEIRARNGSPSGGSPSGGSAMDTTFVTTADSKGNVFAATPSDAAYNAPVIPKLGFVVSPRGQQSWTDPSHPSSVAPGKRPRLTPNPALAIIRGEKIMAFGSPGGDVQTQAMVQCLLNHLHFGFDIQAATEQPRFASYNFPSSFEPHERHPGLMRVEDSLEALTGNDLRARGHKVEAWPELSWLAGSVSMVAFDFRTGMMQAGSDPRRAGYAVGW
jgi:gamma-glutamyltranspeptidase / glutathione hydrolase